MVKFVQRDYTRTEKDDWMLNVQPKLSEYTYSVPVYSGDEKTTMLGWELTTKYE